MKFETVRTNFSQFSDGLRFCVGDGSAELKFDVDRNELLPFAQRLLDCVYDCLNKRGVLEETHNALEALGLAIDECEHAGNGKGA